MADDKLKYRLAYGAASATKILLERVYDALFRTHVGETLQRSGGASKATMTAALILAGMALDERLDESSAAKRYARELILDFPSEVARRVVNGDIKPRSESGGGDAGGSLRSAPMISLIERILAINGDEKREEFVRFLDTLTPEQKATAKRKFRSLLAEDLQRFATLTPASRESLLRFLQEPCIREVLNKEWSEVDSFVKDATAGLRRISGRLREQRKPVRESRS